MSRTKQAGLTVAALAALALGGSAIAGAASKSSTSKRSSNAQKHQGGSGETALTGDTATRVKAAALAKVAGTVVRVETDNGGVYEAHIRKADGTEVEVKVDKEYKVTAVVQQRGRGGRGDRGDRGDRGGRGGSGETALTGDTADKVKAAALAKVSGGTVIRVENDRGGVYEAHVRKADGTEVEVKVDKDFNVTAVEQHGSR